LLSLKQNSIQILCSLTSAISILADTWKRCKENSQHSGTCALVKTPVGWQTVERYSKRHLAVQVCSTNGLRGIFKFSEILGSTSYVSGTTPAEWNSVIVIPVYKKGDMKDPDSYRDINFLNSCYKI
jgi:hypothetical protein